MSNPDESETPDGVRSRTAESDNQFAEGEAVDPPRLTIEMSTLFKFAVAMVIIVPPVVGTLKRCRNAGAGVGILSCVKRDSLVARRVWTVAVGVRVPRPTGTLARADEEEYQTTDSIAVTPFLALGEGEFPATNPEPVIVVKKPPVEAPFVLTTAWTSKSSKVKIRVRVAGDMAVVTVAVRVMGDTAEAIFAVNEEEDFQEVDSLAVPCSLQPEEKEFPFNSCPRIVMETAAERA